MGATFKFKAEKTYTFTEKELGRLLSNHLLIYVTVQSGKAVAEESVRLLTAKTIEEMRDNKLIENLNREYSTIVEEARKDQKESKNG